MAAGTVWAACRCRRSFQDTIRNAKSYIWNFGDGTGNFPTTNYEMSHTYPNVGTYTVMLIAIDPNSCNGADTAYHQILVKNNPATLDFNYAKIPPCTSLSFVFTNLSTAPPAVPFGNTSFSWSFGDGTAPITDGPSQITHSFQSPGSYDVTLSLIDTNYCNYPLDTTEIGECSPKRQGSLRDAGDRLCAGLGDLQQYDDRRGNLLLDIRGWERDRLDVL